MVLIAGKASRVLRSADLRECLLQPLIQIVHLTLQPSHTLFRRDLCGLCGLCGLLGACVLPRAALQSITELGRRSLRLTRRRRLLLPELPLQTLTLRGRSVVPPRDGGRLLLGPAELGASRRMPHLLGLCGARIDLVSVLPDYADCYARNSKRGQNGRGGASRVQESPPAVRRGLPQAGQTPASPPWSSRAA